jgi:signal transduction histidine kinase
MTLKPNQISWVTALLVGGVICTIGVIGATYTVNYVHRELSGFAMRQAQDMAVTTNMFDQIMLHLSSAIIVIFLLISIWGFIAVRRIGRLYESYMLNELNECERELHDVYQENLQKSRLATIGQTASVLAHEMHNPMSSIKLALSGLKGSENLTPRETKKVDLVLGEVDRLKSLLSETLDYVRPVRLSDTPVDLGLLLKQVLKQQEPVIQQQGIQIDTAEVHGAARMCIDKGQFHQVLLNLLKNAIEASPTNETIQFRLKQENDQILFAISNRGKPMDQQTLEHAFEPFFTTKPKGTGLGLGLVKRVVNEHGGHVSIDSSEKNGTTVWIKLPLDQSA